MARAFPVRTCVFTLVPVLVAVSQLFNSYLHGGSLLFTAWFALALLAYGVAINRFHLARYRRRQLSRPLEE
jgi:hypothetical protein